MALLQEPEQLDVTTGPSEPLRMSSVLKANIQPHHHTITDAGNYEYFASNGRSAMAYVLAELIDNSLAATSKLGAGKRREISIEWHKPEELTTQQSYVVVRDNGCGMGQKGLEVWAKFRESQQARQEKDRHKYVCLTSFSRLPSFFFVLFFFIFFGASWLERSLAAAARAAPPRCFAVSGMLTCLFSYTAACLHLHLHLHLHLPLRVHMPAGRTQTQRVCGTGS